MLRVALLSALLTACAVPPHAVPPALALPARPPSAPKGSALATRLSGQPLVERDRAFEAEILAGNVPAHLRRLVPIQVSATLSGRPRTLVYWVTSDYLAAGSDDDFLRLPLRASTAQRLADRLGCLLPTRKIVDDVHRAAVVRLTPRPFSPDRVDITSTEVFAASNAAIEAERRGRTGLISGIKKDVVVSRLLEEKPQRIVIYGWHRPNGDPIQPLSAAHTDGHVDYSHGVRLVHAKAALDGELRDLQALLADPELSQLVSDEGPIGSWRYPSGR